MMQVRTNQFLYLYLCFSDRKTDEKISVSRERTIVVGRNVPEPSKHVGNGETRRAFEVKLLSAVALVNQSIRRAVVVDSGAALDFLVGVASPDDHRFH